MKKYPKVAVLMAVYNGGEWINSQIASVVSQLNCEIHVYIRDDGSDDKSIKEIKGLNRDDLITILRHDGVCTGSAGSNFFKILNYVDCDQYDYISFSDQDDIWFPEKLSSAVELMSRTNSSGYSSNLIAFDNFKSKSWIVDKISNQKKLDYLFQGASAGCTYLLKSDAANLIKKVLAKDLNEFPKGYSHDWVLYAICRSFGLRWVHDNRSFVAYRQHSKNVFGAKPGLSGLLSKLKMANSGWYKKHVLFLRKYMSGNNEELRVFSAIDNMGVKDRFYLVSKVFSFRRGFFDSMYLSIIFAFGLF
jgi:rhamnosyltransferase